MVANEEPDCKKKKKKKEKEREGKFVVEQIVKRIGVSSFERMLRPFWVARKFLRN